jgi:hypothetical protein
LRLLLETDPAGLLRTVSTSQPLTIGHQTSTSGHGFAVDIGAGAVIDRLAVSFAANGVGNRITWTGVEQTTYSLNSLLSGNGAFLESAQRSLGDVRVELPIDYRANVSYRVEPLWILAEIGHGFGGTSFHGGVEKRFERVALRGGARYTLRDWNPTGGIGFDLTRRIGLDLGAFGTSANIERKRRLAFAASIRIRRAPSIVPNTVRP